jgi:hypothetical protein
MTRPDSPAGALAVLDPLPPPATAPRVLRFSRRETTALADNAAHRFAAKHALCIYRANAIYTFIPKNGCSTLRLSLALANGTIGSPEEAGWIHRNNGTFRATLRDLVTADYTFTVLRCPYRRLASAFLDKVVKRNVPRSMDRLLRNRPGRAGRFRRWLARARRPDRRAAPEYGDLTFRSFVRLLEAPGGLMLDPHWAPQSAFLVYEAYDDVFRLEEFEAAWARLRERIGLEVVDARSLIRHGTDQLTLMTEGRFADTPVRELDAMRAAGRVPAPATLYDDDLTAAVTRLYRADVALYAARFGTGGLLVS